jgi:C-terminal processing protease CtpA/Prc
MKMHQIQATHKRILLGILVSLLLLGMVSTISAGKTSKKGYLGVSIERVSNVEKRELGISHGVLVTEVMEESPAEEAGLMEEDIILYFNSKKIRNTDNLVDVVRETEPETEVKVTILRDKKQKDITVKVGKKPSLASVFKWQGDDGLVTILEGNRGYLGVEMRNLNEDLAGYFGVKAEEGVLVLDVVEDSPAEGAGIKAGDVIVSIGGEEVGEAQDVQKVLHDFDPGEEVEVVVMRHKKRQSFKVELDEQGHYSGLHMFKGRAGNRSGLWDELLLKVPEKEGSHIELDEFYRPNMEKEIIRKEGLMKRIKEGLKRIPEEVHGSLKVIREKALI